MKTILFILLLGLSIGIQAQTPVTLTNVNMPFGPQQPYVPVNASLTGFALPSIGTNQTWDYSDLAPVQTYNYMYVTPPTTTFPSTTYADTSVAVNFISQTVYYTDMYYNSNTNYAGAIGAVTKAQKYNISAITSGAQDSCIFPSQSFQYTAPSIMIAFPATENSSWTSVYTDEINFELSITAYIMYHTPCKRVTHCTKLDSVIAWGTIVVPTLSGPSIPYEALLVKREYTTADSFFINGSAAPNTILSAFGLSQGQVTKANKYLFWRPGSVYPAMIVNFGANEFTTPASVYYDGLAEPSEAINHPGESGMIRVYPDPAADYINIAAPAGSNVTIYDCFGKTLQSLTAGINEQSVNTASLASGVFIIRISDRQDVSFRKFIKK